MLMLPPLAGCGGPMAACESCPSASLASSVGRGCCLSWPVRYGGSPQSGPSASPASSAAGSRATPEGVDAFLAGCGGSVASRSIKQIGSS
uniref:Uncharacterized protein n=1 Tax=Oryza brachyantha TaxID=4533 RepID=J3M5M1_ORYBR